jgi:hypothetical protein
MVANAAVSLGSALFTVVDVSWVMTIGGLFAYFFWNVLMIMIMTLVYRESRNPSKTAPNGVTLVFRLLRNHDKNLRAK